MALQPCRECNKGLSKSIQGACPSCGAKDPLHKELKKSLFLLALVVIAVGYLWLANQGFLPGP
ncbi:hypothetical protein D9M68_635910 [compost metagenome]